MQSYIDAILNYKNENVIARYQYDFSKSLAQAENTFQKLMTYIWLCMKHHEEIIKNPSDPSLQFSCIIHEEMLDIDDMWHTFLLFTQDYHDFCYHYLNGKFFHHNPIMNQEPLLLEEYEESLTLYLSYIYKNLGEATLISWFGIEK